MSVQRSEENRIDNRIPLVVFHLDHLRLAVRLMSVDRVVRSVEVTPLLQAPEIVCGAIAVGESVVPVIDLGPRFGRPRRDIRVTDHLLITKAGQRSVALLADSVDEVLVAELSSITESSVLLPALGGTDGVVRFDERLIVLHDLEKMLSSSEEIDLDAALRRNA